MTRARSTGGERSPAFHLSELSTDQPLPDTSGSADVPGLTSSGYVVAFGEYQHRPGAGFDKARRRGYNPSPAVDDAIALALGAARTGPADWFAFELGDPEAGQDPGFRRAVGMPAVTAPTARKG